MKYAVWPRNCFLFSSPLLQSVTKSQSSSEVEVLILSRRRNLNSLCFSLFGGFQETRRLFHYTIWWHFILAPEVWGVFYFFSCTDYGHSMGSSLNLSRDGKCSFVVGWCWKSDSGLGCLSLSGEVTEAHMQPETKWENGTMGKSAASGVRPLGFKFLLCMHQLCDLGQVIELIFLACKMRPVT